MRLLAFCLLLSACQSNDSQVKDDPLGLTGKTGRNVILNISGIDRSETKEGAHTICAIGLNGLESITKEIAAERMVCSDAALGSSTTSITLMNLSYPSYITIFHDENHNGFLDLGTFDIVVAKKTSPVEGVGVIETERERDKFSHPIWADIGNTTLEAKMVYGDLPFWRVVKEDGLKALINWGKSTIENTQKHQIIRKDRP